MIIQRKIVHLFLSLKSSNAGLEGLNFIDERLHGDILSIGVELSRSGHVDEW